MNSIFVFIVLLFSLALLVWFSGYNLSSVSSSESFVTFQQEISAGATIPSATPIPPYAGTSANQNISKVYDNMFYDVNNGNLIEVDSTPYNGTVKDITGTSISKIWISCRKNAGSPIVSYITKPDTPSVVTAESQLPFVNSFQNFVYLTKSKNTNPYVVFYMPWNDSTYIHMIDLSNNQSVVTEMYYGVANSNNTMLYSSAPVPIAKTIQPIPDTNASNNKFITLDTYDKNYSIYQLCSNLFFDVRNGQVISKDLTTNSIVVYARNGSILTSGFLDTKTVVNTNFNVWLAQDTTKAKLLLYISIAQKTMVAIIEPDGNGAYRLFNLQRFLRTGVDSGAVEASSGSPPPTSDAMINDYIKWYFNWTNKGLQDPNNHNFNYSDDYMLKTQIVPPVCPACSTTVGTCVNCSNTNTGTVGADGKSLVGGYPVTNRESTSSAISPTSSTSPSPENNDSTSSSTSLGGVVNNTVDNGTGLLYGTGSGVTNLARDTASGTVGLGREVVGGTVGLGREVVGGTVGLGKDIVGGTVGLGKDIVGGTVGLGKDIVGGIMDLGKSASSTANANTNTNTNANATNQVSGDLSRGGYSNSYAGNGSSSVTDQYSYYGAVPNKGGNYIPLTSDFSKFGR